METIQMHMKWSMNKQNMVYPHDGILFYYKNEQKQKKKKKNKSIATCYTVNEPWKHYAKSNQSPETTDRRIPFIWNRQINRCGK